MWLVSIHRDTNPYLVSLSNVTKQIVTIIVTEKYITKEYVGPNVTHITHPNKTHKTDNSVMDGL